MLGLMSGWLDAVRFGADVQRVMTLRLMQMAAGDPRAAGEAQRMVTEKLAAYGEAQIALMTALATGATFGAAAVKCHAPYRRRVRANIRRLGG